MVQNKKGKVMRYNIKLNTRPFKESEISRIGDLRVGNLYKVVNPRNGTGFHCGDRILCIAGIVATATPMLFCLSECRTYNPDYLGVSYELIAITNQSLELFPQNFTGV